MGYNVFGDIAGNFKTFQALLDKMPKNNGEIPLSLGDLNDRGPDSKGVIDWFMENPSIALNSNHGHMMVEKWLQFDSIRKGKPRPEYYSNGLWEQTGGYATLRSFTGRETGSILKIEKKYIDWLRTRPMYKATFAYIYSHAPIHITHNDFDSTINLGKGFANDKIDPVSKKSIIWNREVPTRRNTNFVQMANIFGHNSSYAVKIYTQRYPQGLHIDAEDFEKVRYEGFFGLCLDTSKANVLSALNTVNMKIYQQEYID